MKIYKTLLLILFLGLSTLLSGYSQSYYLFCVNITKNVDNAWVVDRIDNILSEAGKDVSFMVYYASGTLDGEAIEGFSIEDKADWSAKKEKLKKIRPKDVVSNVNENTNNILNALASQYKPGTDGLSPLRRIHVYWFADKDYYAQFGEPIFLNIYQACDGKSTWQTCTLCNNSNAALQTNNVNVLLNSTIMQLNKIKIK